MAKKWFVLGGSASSFWDPAQPEKKDEFLRPGEARQLEETERVLNAKKGDGLKELSESEAKEYMTEQQAAEQKSTSDAEKKLDKAAKLNEETKQLAKQLKNTQTSLDDLQEEHDDLKEDHEKLKGALNDPDQNPALKEALDENVQLKQQLADLKAAPPAAPDTTDTGKKVK